MPKKQLTDTQSTAALVYDRAAQVMVDYKAPEIPDLGNATPSALIDQIGDLKQVQKDAEKVENILWERLRAMQGGTYLFLRATNYDFKFESRPTVRLDQAKAKEVLEKLGRLEECMVETKTLYKFVKPL